MERVLADGLPSAGGRSPDSTARKRHFQQPNQQNWRNSALQGALGLPNLLFAHLIGLGVVSLVDPSFLNQLRAALFYDCPQN